MEQKELIEQCVSLAWMLWRGIDPDYKRKYARVIWDQFQARLRDEALTTNRLSKYVNQIQLKFPTMSWGDQQELAEEDKILSAGTDRELLRAFREDTALIVVKVRLRNEERKVEQERRYRKWLEEQDEEAVAHAYDGLEAKLPFDEEEEKNEVEN